MRPGIRVLLASLLLVPLWYLAFHRACRSTGPRYGPGGQVASVRSTPANAAKESQPSETTAARVATPETTTQFYGFAPAPPVSATSSQAPRLPQIAPTIAPPTVAQTVDEQNSPPRRPAPRKSAAEVIASTTKNQLRDLPDLKKSADSLPAVGLIIGGLRRGNKGAMLGAVTGGITTNGQRPRTLEPDGSTPYIAGGGAKGTTLEQLVGPGSATSPPPGVTRMSGGTADIAGSSSMYNVMEFDFGQTPVHYPLTAEGSLLTSFNPTKAVTLQSNAAATSASSSTPEWSAVFPRRDPNDRNLESAQGSISPREVLPRNEFSYESMIHTSVALDLEVIKQYNQALNFSDMKSRAEALGLAETNLRRAVDLSSQAVEFLKASPRPTSAQESAGYYSNRLLALAARAQSMSLFVRTVDRSQRAEARAAFFNYIIAEPDAAKKLRAKHLFAQTLFEAEAFEEARVEYERLAAEDPNDSEAKGNLGLVLFELGRRKESEGKTSEARNYFVRAAHYLSEFANEPKMGGPLKARIAEVLEILADKTAAQTVAAPQRSKKP